MLNFFKTAGVAALVLGCASAPLAAQGAPVAALQHPVPAAPVQAKALVALPGLAPNSDGVLVLSATTLRFGTAEAYVDIARRRILSVSSGEERVETGGTAGKVARILIPYGGGLALGAVTHKKVSLLTVEYLDVSGQYHGAVFLIAREDLASTLEQLQTPVDPQPLAAFASSGHCPAQELQTNTVRVNAIRADPTSAFPPEDRALLYENLVRQLQSEKTLAAVYRAGDRAAGASCAEFTVNLRAMTFNKGDQAVRASVGPLGHFVGTTKLAYHLTVTTQSGRVVFDKDMKGSEGSDTDSLNITRTISKTVLKNLKKSRKQVRMSEVVS